MISTPSDQGGSDSHEDHEEGVHGFIDEHVRDGYNISEIQTKLKSVGFSKVEARYSYGDSGKNIMEIVDEIPHFNAGCKQAIFYNSAVLLPYQFSHFMWYLNFFDLGINIKAEQD